MWRYRCGGRWLPPFRLAAFAGGWRTAATGFNPQFPGSGSSGNLRIYYRYDGIFFFNVRDL
jgi:hypothetical protein